MRISWGIVTLYGGRMGCTYCIQDVFVRILTYTWINGFSWICMDKNRLMGCQWDMNGTYITPYSWIRVFLAEYSGYIMGY